MPKKKTEEKVGIERDVADFYDYLKANVPTQFFGNTNDNVMETGLLVYDEIVGGLPVGRIISIASPPGQGKTTLMVQLAQAFQQQNTNVVYIDTERSMSLQRMEDLGLSQDKVIYVTPDSLEDCYSIIQRQIRYKVTKLPKDGEKNSDMVITFDSTTQAPSQQELDQDSKGYQQVGLSARIHSQNLKKIVGPLGGNGVTLILVNQMRTQINIGGFQSFMKGPESDITGGEQLKFYPTQDIRLRKGTRTSEKEIEDLGFRGNVAMVKQVKNRIMSPNIEFPLVLDYDYGFSDQWSSFYFLKALKQEDWKKIGIDKNDVFSSGQWWRINWLGYEKKFRSSQFEYHYITDPDFNKHIDSLVTTVIRRLYKRVKKDYIFTVEDVIERNRFVDTYRMKTTASRYEIDESELIENISDINEIEQEDVSLEEAIKGNKEE